MKRDGLKIGKDYLVRISGAPRMVKLLRIDRRRSGGRNGSSFLAITLSTGLKIRRRSAQAFRPIKVGHHPKTPEGWAWVGLVWADPDEPVWPDLGQPRSARKEGE